MVLLDTHIWLWWLLGDGNLNDAERNALDELASDKKIAVSWVSIWETEMLERKGRVHLKPDLTSWITKAVNPEFCIILAADIDIILAQRQLPENFHADPADRLITSTAILSGFPLATKDQKIIESGACKIWKAE